MAIDLAEQNSNLEIKANALRSRAHVFLFRQMIDPMNINNLKPTKNDLDKAIEIYTVLWQESERGNTFYDLALYSHANRETSDALIFAKRAHDILRVSGEAIVKDKLSELISDLKNGLPYERHFIKNLEHLLAD